MAVKHLICNAKIKYFTDLIEENAHDQRALFKIVNSLISSDSSRDQFPTHTSAQELSERFSNFFIEEN